jgi:hypothetical protein
MTYSALAVDRWIQSTAYVPIRLKPQQAIPVLHNISYGCIVRRRDSDKGKKVYPSLASDQDFIITIECHRKSTDVKVLSG